MSQDSCIENILDLSALEKGQEQKKHNTNGERYFKMSCSTEQNAPQKNLNFIVEACILP